ncbi:MAG: aminotransferase class V-fold PLP-dependent enzyme, partial [Chlamydiia bacterium]|nr:aminotransferase class V-fold PLP-dependent enzyme [Chlamydiia bacterium]
MDKPMTDSVPLEKWREVFPMLHQMVNRCPYIYFDNAATALKPQSVIDAVTRFYSQEYATVHRGTYSKSIAATHHYHSARESIAEFINAATPSEIIFTRGT